MTNAGDVLMLLRLTLYTFTHVSIHLAVRIVKSQQNLLQIFRLVVPLAFT